MDILLSSTATMRVKKKRKKEGRRKITFKERRCKVGVQYSITIVRHAEPMSYSNFRGLYQSHVSIRAHLFIFGNGCRPKSGKLH